MYFHLDYLIINVKFIPRYRNSRGEQPPRYSSNPNLEMSGASAPPPDRERPPPYYSPQH